MSLLFFDNFDGADANPIGSPYVTISAAGDPVQRSGNLAKGTNDAIRSVARISTVTLPTRHRVEVKGGTLAASGGSIRIAAIAGYRTSDGAFVFLGEADDGTLYLSQFDGSSFSAAQATTAYAYASGDVLALEVQADGTLIGYVNGVQQLTGTWAGAGLSGSPGDQGGIWVRGTGSDLQSVALYDYNVSSNVFNPLSGRGGAAAQPLA